MSVIDPLSRRMRLVESSVRVVQGSGGDAVLFHASPVLRLVLVHAGTAHVTTDAGAPSPVPVGKVGLLLAERRHALRLDGETCRATVVAGRATDATPTISTLLGSLRPVRQLSSALTYLAREAVVTAQTRVSADGALLDALATAVLWRFIAESVNYPARLPAVIERARLFIHDHLDDTIELRDIADAASVTPSHLVRTFRRHLDTTPVRYLWDRRVSLGIELLASTNLTVTSIASRCGFATSFHFARKIKAATGLTPTELRSPDARSATDSGPGSGA